jgi:hypothetical protein
VTDVPPVVLRRECYPDVHIILPAPLGAVAEVLGKLGELDYRIPVPDGATKLELELDAETPNGRGVVRLGTDFISLPAEAQHEVIAGLLPDVKLPPEPFGSDELTAALRRLREENRLDELRARVDEAMRLIALEDATGDRRTK